MKHLNFILAGLFFLCGLCCRAQVLPLEENVVLNTKEGQIKGKLLLPGGVKTCPVVLIIAGSGPTDMDGNSAIGNLRNNSLKFRFLLTGRCTGSYPPLVKAQGSDAVCRQAFRQKLQRIISQIANG